MKLYSKALVDTTFLAGVQTGIQAALEVIKHYKLGILMNDSILAFTAICELEEQIKAMQDKEDKECTKSK
jgi:hypothetical protein